MTCVSEMEAAVSAVVAAWASWASFQLIFESALQLDSVRIAVAMIAILFIYCQSLLEVPLLQPSAGNPHP